MRILLTSFLITILVLNLNAQFKGKSQFSGVGVPFFEVELFKTFTKDGKNNHLILYAELLYDDLTFIKNADDVYSAKFEFVITAVSNEEELAYTRTIEKEVFEKDFSLTNSREKKLTIQDDFDLPPGEFAVKLQVNDLVSNKKIDRKIELDLEEVKKKELALSDILLLEEIEKDSTGNVVNIVPHVMNNFPGRIGHFYIYFDVCSEKIPNDIEVKYQFLTKDEEVALDSTFGIQVSENMTGHYIKVDKNTLDKNRYTIILSIEDEDNDAEKKKLLSFYWVIVPQTTEDITLAMRQMRYIMPDDSLDKYLEAPLPEQKKYFKSFWAERDPNPNTPVNELMEEYFKRVNYSNQQYSSFQDNGWLTDRGRILIKFGAPDDIERHPFELNTTPYIVWRYYTLRKIFVFQDRTGFGDYQLLPQYYDQEWR